jgi:peptide/nickel transport system ATP-binding protein
MRGLQDELGMAIMFITHDMGVVAEIADNVVVMEKGVVVENGDVAQIFDAPRHPYTQRLLAAVKRLDSPAPLKAAPPAQARSILSVKDLELQFEKKEGFMGRKTSVVRAVNGVSFELREGEALGIVGESGSGKTTVGRCIARVYDPKGSITYDGTELVTADQAQLRQMRRELRMIFQDPFASLNPRMTVEQIIAEPMLVNKVAPPGEIKARVAKLLTDVGLSPAMMERYPHAFSGGQRQRIVVARAIALDPKVVIADEPTSALDVSIRTQVLDLLLELKAQLGLSFIFISHDMAVIRYFCDRVAVMLQGRVVEIGETDQVINAPQHPYSQALLSSLPISHPAQRGTVKRVRYQPELA